MSNLGPVQSTLEENSSKSLAPPWVGLESNRRTDSDFLDDQVVAFVLDGAVKAGVEMARGDEETGRKPPHSLVVRGGDGDSGEAGEVGAFTNQPVEPGPVPALRQLVDSDIDVAELALRLREQDGVRVLDVGENRPLRDGI
jgi:hypothetical protein